MRATILGVIGLIGVATAAQGQLTALNHLWTVPGVMQTGNGYGTLISCSNLNTTAETIGVDFYDINGTYLPPGGSNSISVAAGGTVILGTGGSVAIAVTVNYQSGLFRGRAEIRSTATKGIACSAFLADQTFALPSHPVSLTIVKKTKQKGD